MNFSLNSLAGPTVIAMLEGATPAIALRMRREIELRITDERSVKSINAEVKIKKAELIVRNSSLALQCAFSARDEADVLRASILQSPAADLAGLDAALFRALQSSKPADTEAAKSTYTFSVQVPGIDSWSEKLCATRQAAMEAKQAILSLLSGTASESVSTPGTLLIATKGMQLSTELPLAKFLPALLQTLSKKQIGRLDAKLSEAILAK